jgi:hypothetical protein
MTLNRDAGLDRHQLERPKDDLAEVTNRGHRVSNTRRWRAILCNDGFFRYSRALS